MILALPRLAACLLIVASLYGSAAQAVLIIGTRADILAATAAFGPAQRLLDWSGGFAVDSNWTFGSYGGSTECWATFTDATTSSTVTGNLSITSGIDGAGFDKAGVASPELALNGPESGALLFLGFALTGAAMRRRGVITRVVA